ncbi:hypothetical protein FHQ18_09115 [Deferribacter autotrophicus]|uniref:KAP NTPase domain-containing protein n=1 Tax=Deferribacter autotrophicus TaxID=500465 RepID=A0A5A8F1C9_9BACT|nr:P-loop NTPase fold protein [Deferribacter autotrophicus]KAA0257492.1 hypothetical protein FHQ18_09115 [Deferribacter autotrophicus]
MEISTFKDDLLGLEDFAKRLEQFIKIESDYVEGSLVIGLNSKFGSGKTTFLKMWMSSFQEDQNKADKPLVILLNAWESDYYGDPLFAIISALIECIKKHGESAENLINAAKDFGWFTLAMGGQIVKKFTGIDAFEAGEIAATKKLERNGKLPLHSDAFSIYEARKKAMESLKQAIREFVESSSPKVLFLVDELDRCRPDYAISYLETIKHIFDIKGAVFLLAVDRQQLENSAKAAFGSDLDFNEYYRKFVHREVTLPDISENAYRKIARKYVDYYLEREGERYCLMKLDSHCVDNIVELISSLKLTPRQIQEVFRILGHLLETTEEKRGSIYWCLGVASIMMSVLKVGRQDVFHLLGTQQFDYMKAFIFFKDDLNINSYDWWFMLCLTGGGLKLKEGEDIQSVMKKVGLLENDEEFNSSSTLVQWFSGWGHSCSDRFAQIYKNIEQLNKWV